uniref:Inhibitor of growth protein N-terminal histone-binding domain-containing protein n=1 Tax=Trichuris muris TaxID=70415 RepID=A0A5S6QDJ1_TRIMR
MDIANEIFENKRKALKDEIRQVDDGTHPELVKAIKAIEEEHERLVNSRIPIMLKEAAHAQEVYYNASIEMARKSYSESFEEIREKLLHQLKEERAQIEMDFYNDELDNSDNLLLTTPRNLRRRFNDEVPSLSDVEQREPKPLPTLSGHLPPAEIEQHLRYLHKWAKNNNESDAEDMEDSVSESTPNLTSMKAETPKSADLKDKVGATCYQRPPPPADDQSTPKFNGTEQASRLEPGDRPPPEVQACPRKQIKCRVGTKVAVQSQHESFHATISKIEPGRIVLTNELVNLVASITLDDLRNGA